MLSMVTCFTTAALKLQNCDKGNSASKKNRANSISRMHPRGSNNFVKIGFSLRRNDQKLHVLTRIRHFSSFWKAKSLEIPSMDGKMVCEFYSFYEFHSRPGGMFLMSFWHQYLGAPQALDTAGVLKQCDIDSWGKVWGPSLLKISGRSNC